MELSRINKPVGTEAYCYIIPKGTFIYRGKNQSNDISGNWYAFNTDDCKAYASEYIGKFIVKEDIHLVNVLSKTFHIDYMDKLNMLFEGNNKNGIDDQKLLYMIPFGLPNFDIQKHVIEQIYKIKIDDDNSLQIKMFMASYYEVNRFSMYDLDKNVFVLMNNLYYPIYDGFTTPLKCYSKIQKGCFVPEIALFDLKKIELVDKLTQLSGGSKNKSIVYPINIKADLSGIKNLYPDTSNINIIKPIYDPTPFEELAKRIHIHYEDKPTILPSWTYFEGHYNSKKKINKTRKISRRST